jgi:predicted transcriptional regulator
MRAKLETVTDTELAILREIWNRGSATIRQITDALYREGTAPQYATVQKLLERLEAKDCVARDRDTRAHRFRALVSRDEFLGHRLQALADKLCDGSLVPLLTTLVRAKGISGEDRESMRRLIDELSGRRAPREVGRRARSGRVGDADASGSGR